MGSLLRYCLSTGGFRFRKQRRLFNGAASYFVRGSAVLQTRTLGALLVQADSLCLLNLNGCGNRLE